MATPVIMPKQGQSVESCIIGEWHKQVGDQVKVGDKLFTYETDKATFDETAQVEGTLLARFFEEGDDIPVLTNVCVIGQPGESFAEFAPTGATAATESAAPATQAAASVSAAPISAAPAAPTAAANAAPAVTTAAPAGPVATPVIMPRQGQSVESCIIGEWHKQVGDEVKVGDKLFTYETDKATFDETATIDGTLLAIFFEAGDDVPVLTNVCAIGQPGDSFAELDPRGASKPAAAQTAQQDAAAIPAAGSTPAAAQSGAAPAAPAASSVSGFDVSAGGDMPKAISPRARALAARSGADLRFAEPSGPKNRVIERDVNALIEAGRLATSAAGSAYPAGITGTGIGGRVTTADIAAAAAASATAQPTASSVAAGAAPVASAATAAAPTAAELEADSWTEKHTNIRKVIARSMHASLSNMAQLTLNTSFDATDIMALRSRLKKAGEQGLTAEAGFALAEKVPTLNDLIVYAASRVIKRHPACNAHYDDTKMTFFRNVHMGIAVDTPRGLMVPTVFKCDEMGVTEISETIKQLAADCQTGTINPDLLQGGTFTITNLGTLGIESFTPVINPPQTCILGVNTIETRVREVNGELKAYPAMGLSLTFDHRAVDGAPAGRFLKDLKTALENISLLLMS
ncbi:MAG: 2-oxo acid dehydrogenase subunit E2 [Saccharofermentanales bacterium]